MFTGWIRQAISIDVRLALPFPSRGGWPRRGRRGVRFMADPPRGVTPKPALLSVRPVFPSNPSDQASWPAFPCSSSMDDLAIARGRLSPTTFQNVLPHRLRRTATWTFSRRRTRSVVSDASTKAVPAWPDPSATGEYASNNVSAREGEHFERKPD